MRTESRAPKTLPPDPFARHARALLADIATHLPEVVFFTREDLLHLPCFEGVATITRYRYVCGAVDLLLRQGKLVSKSRTDLTLPRMQRSYEMQAAMATNYEATLTLLIMPQRAPFSTMDVVRAWKTDQHLTENAKRVATRSYLRELARRGLVRAVDFRWQRTNTGGR